MKSHMGAMISLGKGATIADSTKQKVNSCTSAEAELNAVDDKISKVLWVKKFLEAQGVNIIYKTMRAQSSCLTTARLVQATELGTLISSSSM